MAVHTYSRRAFLKAAGLAAGALLLAPSSALGAATQADHSAYGYPSVYHMRASVDFKKK